MVYRTETLSAEQVFQTRNPSERDVDVIVSSRSFLCSGSFASAAPRDVGKQELSGPVYASNAKYGKCLGPREAGGKGDSESADTS